MSRTAGNGPGPASASASGPTATPYTYSASSSSSSSETRLMSVLGDLQSEIALLLQENRDLKKRLSVYEPLDRDHTLPVRPSFKLPTPVHHWPHVSNQHLELLGHRDGVWDINCCLWDHSLVVSASADSRAILWRHDSSSGLYFPSILFCSHKGSVNSARFHPSLPLLCTASGDRAVHIHRVPGHSTSSTTSEDKDRAFDVQTHEDEVYSGSNSRSFAQSVHRAAVELKGSQAPVTCATWSAHGSHVVSGSWDKLVRVFDIAAAVRVLTSGASSAGAAAGSPPASFSSSNPNPYDASSRDDDVSAQVHAEYALLHVLSGHSKAVTYVDCHPSLPLLLSASEDHLVCLWDLRTAGTSPSGSFDAHSHAVRSALFSPNGELMASAGDDKTIHLWDLRNTKSPIVSINCPSPVNRVCFSPSFSSLAAPCDDGCTRVYSLQGQLTTEYFPVSASSSAQVTSRANRGPRGPVAEGSPSMTCAAWTRDESVLLCGGWDRVLHGWTKA